MLHQSTLWRFLKRDASNIVEEEDNSIISESSEPSPKRWKSGWSSGSGNGMWSLGGGRSQSSPALSSKMDCGEEDTTSTQMLLDCGQKRIGPETCPSCGMVYSPTDCQDQALHQRHHRQAAAPARFRRRLISSSSLFVCVQQYSDGSIYKCCFSSELLRQPNGGGKNGNRQSILDICGRMNGELGGGQEDEESPLDKLDGRQMYVFVGRSPESSVIGVLIVDQVKFAYRYGVDGRVDDQPESAAMGVSRVWTWAGARRRRVATRLLECARCNFYFGAPIQRKHVAFSDPTMAGLQLAKHYCQQANVLVYRFA